MNENINTKIAEYEDSLRDAERAIESALQAICPLGGVEELGNIRKSLNEALGLVTLNIHGAYRLYDNPDIKEY